MKVKAKHWICYNGTFKAPGEEFTIKSNDLDEMKDSVTVVETPITWRQEEETEKKPTRRKKSDE